MQEYTVKNEHKGIKRIGIIVAIALAFFAGMSVNSYRSVKKFITEEGDVNIVKVLDLYGKTRSDAVSFDQYWEVWNTIKDRFVDQPVNDVDLFYGSLKGLVGGLNDPYSAYFPPGPAKEFTESLQGEFGGIGAEIGMRDNQLVVIAPLPNTPADRAGLKPGDFILKINDEETFGLALDEAVLKIRGESGSTVVLSVIKKGKQVPEEVSIVREKINIPSVTSEMKKNNIGYIRISNFNNKTVDEFDTAIKDLLSHKPKGLILDMRRNPGGYLDSSVLVASEWIKDGVIVRERFTDKDIREHKTSGKHRLMDLQTIVLVDEGTASGAEIVAGALQDYGVAKIVGTKTFGKGSVQDFEFLRDGSALKLTIAKWFTPKDRGIDKEGITPDIVIEEMFEVKKGADPNDTTAIKDKGVEKALELLQSK